MRFPSREFEFIRFWTAGTPSAEMGTQVAIVARSNYDATSATEAHHPIRTCMTAKTTRTVTDAPRGSPGAAGFRRSEGRDENDSSVRAIFLRRMRRWTRDLARSAPSALLADALSQPSARGTMVHLLSVFAPSAEETEAQQLRERALERALVAQEELREAAGGFRSTAWVADHLKVRRQSVDKRRREGRLLAQDTPAGYLFPACQFSAVGTVPGLEEVLDALGGGSFWETLAALVTPSPALDGRSVIESLQTARSTDDRKRIVAVAPAYAST